MLIIAIPKSASTSLLETLKRLHVLSGRQDVYPDLPVPEETRLLHRYHTDMREFREQEIEFFTAPDFFMKEHVPPTENNLRLLRDKKKIVLLRAPADIVAAYWRAERRRLHDPRPEFAGVKTAEEWRRRAEENGLRQDLQWYVDGWTEEERAHPEHTLIVQYRDLVNDQQAVVNRIEEFWGLPVSPTVTLEKKRYSRYPYPVHVALQWGGAVRRACRRFLVAVTMKTGCHGPLKRAKNRILGK